MAVKPELSLRQVQRLALTPAMRQSLGILRMEAGELAELVAREVAENPFLILRTRPGGSGGTAYDYALATVAARPGLMEDLRHQLRSRPLRPEVLAIAEYLASELREDGYLDLSLGEMEQTLGLEPALIEAGLKALQACEPAGIGARDLTECLVLQLVDRGLGDELARGAVAYLEDFGQARFPLIARRLKISETEARRIGALLRGLDPRPVRPDGGQVALLLPDVRVRRGADGAWRVELTGTMPSLRLDTRLVKQAGGFAQEQRTRAEALSRAITQRGETLLRIATAIVDRQEAYFSLGPDHLRPMHRRDLADALNMHPSTLGRAVAGKGLEIGGQIVPLASFFSTPIPGRGGEDLSSFVIRRSIARLVAAEPAANPLSDAKIHAHLTADGVDIARRTIAKYREGMKIPSSHERRRRRARQDVPDGGN